MNTDNTPMDLPQDVAKKLFAEGAILLLTGIPIGTEFGIDLCSYTSGEKFRGVKMIPPGPHVVFCSSQGPHGGASAPRVGFVHHFKPYELLVREWDSHTEELRVRNVPDPELEAQQIRANIKGLDQFLAPYDYRFVGDWKNLTDTITEETVKNCSPECGVVRTNIALQSCPDAERPRGNPSSSLGNLAHKVVNEDDLLPNLKPIDGTAPRFSLLPDRVPKDCSPAEVSQHHLDSVQAVEEFLSKFPKPEQLLIAEIQFAFVLFLICHSVESLAHWRKCLNLLSNTEAGVAKFKLFFMKYLEILAYQLPHLPEELMEPGERNTVYKDVRSLLRNTALAGLSVSAEKLSRSLEKSMAWHFEGLLDEDPEDMPVVVEA